VSEELARQAIEWIRNGGGVAMEWRDADGNPPPEGLREILGETLNEVCNDNQNFPVIAYLEDYAVENLCETYGISKEREGNE
jgi:hypothetical protein